MNCRHCKTKLSVVFADLGTSPPSNSFLRKEQLAKEEAYYPLKIFVCTNCFLVQVDEYKSAKDIFNDEYVYFSSYSKSWLKHASYYCDLMTDRFGLNENSYVIEIASNDGYLLQYFNSKKIPVLGIEPTANTAEIAIKRGIPTKVKYFGVKTAEKLLADDHKADLLLGNNVLAHVPDINDFVKGMKIILSDEGVITMEFPHLYQLIKQNQFDTIYHEHFSYLSFTTVKQIFEASGLEMFDVEELSTHGGSLRVFAKHLEDKTKEISPNVKELLKKEEAEGIIDIEYYYGFQKTCDKIKSDFLSFIHEARKEGKKIAGYGAAAKGNTLMNYCRIKKDDISYVVDANPHKQNKYLPGIHTPVVGEEVLKKDKPDYVIIFPWNIKEEIINQLDYIRAWGGKFVIAIPELTIL